jgi:hypothetical protein
MLTMVVLIVASTITWARAGNAQLRENWIAGQAPSASGIAHQIFNGLCIGMLGLTGFECMLLVLLPANKIFSSNNLCMLKAFRPT